MARTHPSQSSQTQDVAAGKRVQAERAAALSAQHAARITPLQRAHCEPCETRIDGPKVITETSAALASAQTLDRRRLFSLGQRRLGQPPGDSDH